MSHSFRIMIDLIQHKKLQPRITHCYKNMEAARVLYQVAHFVVELMNQAIICPLKNQHMKLIIWGTSQGRILMQVDFLDFNRASITTSSKISGGFTLVSMLNHKIIELGFKNLEIQVGQLAKQIADNSSSKFGANIENNPKEECKAMITRGKLATMAEEEKDEKIVDGDKQQLVTEPTCEPEDNFCELEEIEDEEDDQENENTISKNKNEINDEKKKEKEKEEKEKENNEKKMKKGMKRKREMAPRKLASKRSRKDKAAKGTSSAPEYDSHRFRSAEHQQRFEAIKGWSFLRERRVQLRDDEYTNFREEIVRRRWASLVTPMAKFDPDIVLEFYANAWPTEEGVRDMRSWVRGQWIPFDADAIGQFLGYPLVLEEGQECEYGQRRNRSDGFDEEAIAQLLCIPGQDFARTTAGRRVRIMRTNMTILTQIWMTLLLSNIQPSDHNSDLPLLKCQLVYAILTRMSNHVAQLIADAIYIFAGMAPTRHPLDPDKSNRALGFPALITELCQSFGVPVAPSKVIRPPITRAFIEKYCTQRQAQGDAPQAADAPPPH
ncbi:hypothetical protein HKD37_05G012994 [Glycine soja]